MSPRGRVKVALAGAHTSMCFACFTLPDAAEIGKLTTKKAEPTIVATRQAGRTIMKSVSIRTPGSSCARAGLAPDMSNATAHTAVRTLVFMSLLLPSAAPLSNKNLSSDYPKMSFETTTLRNERSG